MNRKNFRFELLKYHLKIVKWVTDVHNHQSAHKWVMFLLELNIDILEFHLNMNKILNSGNLSILKIILKINTEMKSPSIVKNKARISNPPGSILISISKFVYSKKTYEHIFRQTIADMQGDYFEALHESRVWLARWVRVRGTWSIWAAAVMQIPVSSSKLIRKIWTLVG